MKKYTHFTLIALIAIIGSTAFYCRETLSFENKKVTNFIVEYIGTSDFTLTQFEDSNAMSNIYAQLSPNITNATYVFIGRVNSCRAGGCNNTETPSDDAHNDQTSEYFDYVAILDSTFEIKRVKIINYHASHGYEITNKGWLKQFIGLNENSYLEVGKDVDAIAGATISVYAMTNNINDLPNKFKQVVLNDSLQSNQALSNNQVQ